MEYYISKKINGDFDTTKAKVIDLLKEIGFGIQTNIDVQTTLKEKLNVPFKRYEILGACNPHYAHKAFLAEDKIGALLPCNVLVIEQGDGITEIAIMNAGSMMQLIGNEKLIPIGKEVSEKLVNILDKI